MLELTLSNKDSDSWVFALLAGIGANALATAKKAKRVAKTFIACIACSMSNGKKINYEDCFICGNNCTVEESIPKFRV